MLGIAERQNVFEFPQDHIEIRRLKPLKNKVNSLGGWIQAKRIANNLAPGHLASKMGIAATMVRSWESGISRPDEQKMKDLAEILGRNVELSVDI